MPLAGHAVAKLSSEKGVHLTVSTRDNSTATFPQMLPGEYDIEVTALGYKTTVEHASVFTGGTTSNVYVYLQIESEGSLGDSVPGRTIMTPRLERCAPNS
jgi:hypothetical protein